MQITMTETTGYIRPDGVYDVRRTAKVVETTDHAPIAACNEGDLVAIFNGTYWSVSEVSSVHPECAILENIAWPLDRLYQPLPAELQAYAESRAANQAGIARAQAMIATLDACEQQAEADDTMNVARAGHAHTTTMREARTMSYTMSMNQTKIYDSNNHAAIDALHRQIDAELDAQEEDMVEVYTADGIVAWVYDRR